jgi:SAM-dependent methyltransferase
MSEAHDRNYWNLMSRGTKYIRAITDQSDPVVYDSRGEADAVRLSEVIPDCANLTVLEWGCGAGRVTKYLDALFKRVIAVDISQGMIGVAQALQPPLVRTEFQVIGGNAVKLSDHSIDLVYSFVCWMHLMKADLAAVLAECKRVLVPGGRCVFQLPVYASGGLDRNPAAPSSIACWTRAELEALLASQGWTTTTLNVSPGAFDPAACGPSHFALHEIVSAAK